MNDRQPKLKKDWLQITLLLVLGLMLGLVFMFALPPWQHYDEPNHFEYVWLAANLDRLPQPGDYDRELSQQVMISMGLNRFWGDNVKLSYQPDEKVVIQGYSQLDELPLYYLIASLPLRFLKDQPIEIQLYAARSVSLLFFLITIFAAWASARELTQEGSVIRWLLPLSIILLPSFTDLMTAVNSDAAAVAEASLFFWISLRLLKRGFSLFDFLLLTILGGLTVFTKNTAMFVLVIYPLVLLFSLVRNGWRTFSWGLIFTLGAAILAGVLLVDEPLYWYRATLQPEALRQENQQAPHGSFVLSFFPGNQKSPDWWPLAAQALPEVDAKNIAGKGLVFGFWVWGDQPAEISSPIIHANDFSYSIPVVIDTTPQFFSYSFKIPKTTKRIWLTIDPAPKPQKTTVYFDGFVLVEGNPNMMQAPEYPNDDANVVLWGSNSYRNLLRNASLEKVFPRFRPVIDQFGVKILPDGIMPSMLLETLFDYRGMRQIHKTAAERLFQNFWGKFSWGHIGYLGWRFMDKPYLWLAVFSSLGLIGGVIFITRRGKQLDKTLLVIIVFLLMVAWGFNFMRGIPYLVNTKLYLSVARHVFPVIIPTMLLFVTGWNELISLSALLLRTALQRFRIQERVVERSLFTFRFLSYGALILVWIGCTVGALISILTFYKII